MYVRGLSPLVVAYSNFYWFRGVSRIPGYLKIIPAISGNDKVRKNKNPNGNEYFYVHLKY